MDFDGDGNKDVITGTYDGQIVFFKGDGTGQYESGVNVKDRNGSDLVIDNATVVSAYDWDKDGKPDLIVGTISGPVWYVHNAGGLRVDPPVQIQGLEAADGGPAAVDWDGDGIMDLFLGNDTGSLLYFKGKKAKEAPEFENPVEILPPLSLLDSNPVPAVPGDKLDWSLPRPGMRPKPSVADWNGDGKPDLLVGDFRLLEGRPLKLPPDKQSLFEALRKEQHELQVKSVSINDRIRKAACKELGYATDAKLTGSQTSQLDMAYDRLYQSDDEASANDKRLGDIFTALQPMLPPVDYHGFVWVFLRK